MKRYVLFLILPLLFSNCNTSTKNSSLQNHPLYLSLDTIPIYNTESYDDYKFLYEKNKNLWSIDICELDSLKAEIDNFKSEFKYFIGYEDEYIIKSIENLPIYLKESYNIDTIIIDSGCIRTGLDKYDNCYPKVMSQKLKDKYGNDFIEKAKRIVDSIYLIENIDLVHKRSEVYQLHNNNIFPKYLKFQDLIGNELSRQLNFPTNFKLKENSLSSITVIFNLYKTGKIDSLRLLSHGLEKHHDDNLKSQLENLIQNKEWLPNEAYGMVLNTEEVYFVPLE
ncbi:hypothetical protein Q2T40_20430 [Winogradskyella maritima]|uniref:TonB C-terminal domain-containing protein n=1 Tax=Winogradskyella maritima TaxID=1517766 RepID=A0ABV8AH06_9FLAO|nr:hypothetical protein [Winogradskyella maritima]